MADFSDAERAYVALLERAKASLPPELYRSVRRLEITDEMSLLNSFFFFVSSEFHESSQVRLAGSMLATKGGIRIKKLQARSWNDFALNFTKITEAQRRTTVQGYFATMMKYLPGLSFTIEPSTAYLEDEELKATTALFLEHLRKNRARLLAGPPHKNEHTINREKAAEWVAAQKSDERKRLAGLLLEQIRYISHSELLTALEECVERTHALLKPGPVVFLTGSPKKSNYYISLLFAHFWLQKGYPIDGVMDSLRISGLSIKGNFIDIDDMSYSGSQTNSVLGTAANIFLNDYHEQIRNALKDKTTGEDTPEYSETHMFLPRYLVEQSLQEVGFQFLLVRAFMSRYSFDLFSTDNVRATLPLQIVTSEVIEYMPDVSPQDKRKLESLFNDTVYTTVYFDHKVADTASTYLYPISFGIVPKKSIVESIGWNYDPGNIPRLENAEQDKDEGIEFLPFINHCEKERRPGFPTTRATLLKNATPNSLRCPVAWYKYIDYDAEPVAPPRMNRCGPAGCTVMGGRRTRRKRSKKRRKTRRY